MAARDNDVYTIIRLNPQVVKPTQASILGSSKWQISTIHEDILYRVILRYTLENFPLKKKNHANLVNIIVIFIYLLYANFIKKVSFLKKKW